MTINKRYIPVSYTHLDVYKRQVQEEVKEEMPVVQQEKRPTLNDMELEADEEEDEPLVFEDDGREIPYLINREPVFRLEKKERKKKRKKKKRRSIFYFIPFVKKRVDKKEAEICIRDRFPSLSNGTL